MKLSSEEIIDRIMTPSSKLMSKIGLRTKLVGMLSAFCVAILVLGVSLLTKQNSELNIARDELAGVVASRQVFAIIHQLQADRMIHTELLGASDPKLLVAAKKSHADLQASVKQFESTLNDNKAPELAKTWSEIAIDLKAITSEQNNATLHRFDDLVRKLHELTDLIHEKSGLLFDPESDSYLLMDVGLQRLPEWIESLSRLSSLSVILAQAGDNGPLDYAELTSARDALLKAIQQTERMQAALERSGEEAPAFYAKAKTDSQTFLSLLQAQLKDPELKVDVKALLQSTKQASAQSLQLQDYWNKRLQTILGNRVGFGHTKSYLTLFLLLVSIAATLYFTYGFYLNFVGAIETLEGSAKVVAAGDLTQIVHVEGKDELAITGAALEQMSHHLSALVANVRTNASMVLELGQNLTEGINDMAIRTEQQAHSLLDTTTSVESLSETVRTNAQNAKSVDNLASNVRMIAESSNDIMLSAVQTMNGIHESAMKIQEIVSMIDKIAFQTDILALNAAVEAAHAGEQGKGFAVVANEVRNLAQRSAESARQIRRLIDDAVNRVESGVEQINDVSMTLTDIVGGIRNLAKDINSISVASAEQSDGLIHISDAIRELDAITKSNSQMAENAKYASSELENRAVRLKEVVSTFRLRQGTADEAFAMVKKASALYRIVGMDVLSRITLDAEKQFSDRDMYVFAFDRQGQYCAFAGNEEKLSVNLFHVPGLDGKQLVADAFALPASGGWVDYSIENPVSKRVEWKSSYIERIDDDIVIGCGVYKSV
ncbi:methyl-accepting chemotaxis protein [Undibacterium cyanobacteriorum]|uniref:Methyl-accepting chemotaxis protein n=1 Tax=Undibacterium cyanobacteriorum TaxID=3073561 RepID=A0ABY9RJG6_9BURK|nr:methyl-accepting chemotaxis protein [Undibacterium sp. 20NA77.5]WMW80974.1 methyl-accepting chemotaxis protein [Undibacterium sp. 20NA77.5]